MIKDLHFILFSNHEHLHRVIYIYTSKLHANMSHAIFLELMGRFTCRYTRTYMFGCFSKQLKEISLNRKINEW